MISVFVRLSLRYSIGHKDKTGLLDDDEPTLPDGMSRTKAYQRMNGTFAKSQSAST